MAKAKKIKEPKVEKEKTSGGDVFEYITWLTTKKRKWEELSYDEQKKFNPFILARFLGMDLYYCETINQLQPMLLKMEPEKVWRIYYELLPPVKPEIKFIKSKNESDFSEREIFLVKKHFNIREDVAIEYLTLLKRTDEGKDLLKQIEINYTYEK